MKFNSSNEKKQFYKYDPRPDLKQDHQYWKLLLKEAEKRNLTIYNSLHGFRCIGATLQIKDNKIKLISKTNYWNSAKEWNNYRNEFLLPYKEEISALFNHIKELLQ